MPQARLQRRREKHAACNASPYSRSSAPFNYLAVRSVDQSWLRRWDIVRPLTKKVKWPR
jgi:hypothetical protein